MYNSTVILPDQWSQNLLNLPQISDTGPITLGALRLDAAESIWFRDQLRYVDSQEYTELMPGNLARTYVPTQNNVPEWAMTYTWRQFALFGKAKFIGGTSSDIPRSDATGAEQSRVIKLAGAAYGYDFREVKASRATNVSLDTMKNMAARFALEDLLDETLALGNAEHGLDGLLTLSSVPFTIASDKSAGGKLWVNATSDEIAADIMQMGIDIAKELKQARAPGFTDLTVLLPVDLHGLISSRTMRDGSDLTILRHCILNSPYISAIEPWQRCDTAGAGGVTRMVAYPRNPLVVAGIVPMEIQSLPAVQYGLEFLVNMVMSCGGVVVRFPVAMRYMDGI